MRHSVGETVRPGNNPESSKVVAAEMRIRVLPAIIAVVCVVGVLPATTPQTQAETQTSKPAGAATDQDGVVGRRVSEVVAEQRGARRLGFLDPKLIDYANDPSAFIDTTGRVFFADIGLGSISGSETASAAPAADVPGPPTAQSQLPEQVVFSP